MEIATIGLDLAKNVFQVHGVNERGKAVLRKQLRRDQVAPFFANLPACLVGIEACASAHHWARKLQALGHTVRLMAPQFVKPHVKSNKNDAADAEAICEAVARPSMRFVPTKNVEQQSVLSLHRVRQGFVRARTAQANPIETGNESYRFLRGTAVATKRIKSREKARKGSKPEAPQDDIRSVAARGKPLRATINATRYRPGPTLIHKRLHSTQPSVPGHCLPGTSGQCSAGCNIHRRPKDSS